MAARREYHSLYRSGAGVPSIGRAGGVDGGRDTMKWVGSWDARKPSPSCVTLTSGVDVVASVVIIFVIYRSCAVGWP